VAVILRLLPEASEPVFLSGIFLLVLADFIVLRRRSALILLHPEARHLRWILAVLYLLWMLFPMSYYSDDWIRHVYDGLQLVRGRPVYRMAPVDLPHPEGFDLLPDHAHRQTIYLPFTQLQAWAAGILFYQMKGSLTAKTGFAMVWTAVTAVLFLLAWRRLRRNQRAILISLLTTSPFLVFSASLHADVQGMLAGLALLSERNGILAVLLPLIKPEGGFLSLQAFLEKEKKAGALAFYLQAASAFLLMALFSFLVLWPSKEDFYGFLQQAQFYSNWWMAYHPVVYVLERSGYSVYEAAILYRIVCLPFILILAFFFRNRWIGDCTVGWIGLIVYFFYRLALHPWYFLWLLPFLILRGAKRVLNFFPVLLLWYAVIPDYRAGQGWHEETFFLLFGVTVSLLLLIDRKRSFH
jgi:hypothetical protein